MLDILFGSKNAERVLLFLLVNGSCYGSEIQKAFDVSLSPIQSILYKFEKAGIVLSELQGNKKLFRLDPSYPLYADLKSMLKTAFVHLPSAEKRQLFSWQSINSSETIKSQKKRASTLHAFWKRLQAVQSVSIQTESAGRAFGKVLITKEKDGVLVFTEQGQWAHEGAQGIHFSKALRWKIDYTSATISLEHLHYGASRPVFLFHLTPVSSNTLQSIDSHLCLSDCYFGRITFNENNIQFLWRILGPRKNEILYHVYS
jgi:hypothetical protein